MNNDWKKRFTQNGGFIRYWDGSFTRPATLSDIDQLLTNQKAEMIEKVKGLIISSKEIERLKKQGFGAEVNHLDTRNETLDQVLSILEGEK